MTNLAALDNPIAPEQLPALQPALERLQGNILRGHKRKHAVHVFLRFTVSAEQVKSWIYDFADSVTSAWEQDHPIQQEAASSPLFTNFFLSADGYTHLQLFEVARFADSAFMGGMKNTQTRLQDPGKETWDPGYSNTIHAMILLAHDNKQVLPSDDDIRNEYGTIADIVAIERGRVMRVEGKGVEHFGYVDGRSQPLFFQEDVNQEQGGTSSWRPDAGPSLVIVPDPHGGSLDFGSYMVFRKLEQNARGFAEKVRELSVTLGISANFVGAQAIGRFQDGTPLVLYDKPGCNTPISNNFNFNREDRYGLRCPFHAHIRKVNPRDELDDSRSHRIVRRGITYGERDKEPKDNPSIDEMPSEGVGLLFMCYQRDITQQFEFLQVQWANEKDRLKDNTGLDPVIGQNRQEKGEEPSSQKWRETWSRTGTQPASFQNFVTLKGGEYFFAPSKNVLKSLTKL